MPEFISLRSSYSTWMKGTYTREKRCFNDAEHESDSQEARVVCYSCSSGGNAGPDGNAAW